jgi:pyridoxamine 5'-phosphate oxidase
MVTSTTVGQACHAGGVSDFEVPAQPRGPRLDLAAMRVRYVPGPLLEHDVDASPFVQFRRWLAEAVAAGLPEPNAMVLSTVDADGRPASRHVLLKQLDDTGFVFYTNLASTKARHLAENPGAALCFGWFPISRQVCVTGRVEQVDRVTAAQYWAERPRESQLGAWVSEQSMPVASRQVLRDRLAALEQEYPPGAPVPLPDFWGGYRLLPDTIELWQGQPGRLHDRLVYERAERGWSLSRRQP